MSDTSHTQASSVPAGQLAKAEAKAKLDFELHVALIMRNDNVPKAKAQFRAWLEGRPGLELRLNPAPVSPGKG